MAADTAGIEAESKPKGGGKLRLRTFDELDARTRARKRADELRRKLIADAGEENLTQADLMRIDQTVFMSSVIEDMHVRALQEDGKIDRASLATLVNTCSRNLDAVTARTHGRPAKSMNDASKAEMRDLARAIMLAASEQGLMLTPKPAEPEPEVITIEPEPEPDPEPFTYTLSTGAWIREEADGRWSIHAPDDSLYGHEEVRERAEHFAQGLTTPKDQRLSMAPARPRVIRRRRR
ncbi:hypothetical protein [Methyloceanibacter sp.]|uniref:hypothetical protein n=1 Tax=Methyloceanibacter sp. TaxID=1965321 RepID=UPI002CC5F442|nr:hypothetical protein [Methyloceanibacter sp.]HML93409.1 hypothetical protein [Methyloceanibacter sp.]